MAVPTADEKRNAAQQRIPNQQRRSASSYFTRSHGSRVASEPFTMLHVRIPDVLMARMAAFGNQTGLNASESARTLITHALDALDQEESQ